MIISFPRLVAAIGVGLFVVALIVILVATGADPRVVPALEAGGFILLALRLALA